MRVLRPRRTYWLGTHQVNWLASAGVPLFLSYRRLRPRKALPRAAAPWALDSGGFTELSLHGRWTVDERCYVADVCRYQREIGKLAWAAPMDWMCEPHVLRKTGHDVVTHQRFTIDSYERLRWLAPDVPWIPVLQGWSISDYWEHCEMYERRGINLHEAPVVGVGSICRRQHQLRASLILSTLAAEGLRLHGFGLKLTALQAIAPSLASADSLAWSFDARRAPPLPGHAHKNCANCLGYALAWRQRALEAFNTRS